MISQLIFLRQKEADLLLDIASAVRTALSIELAETLLTKGVATRHYYMRNFYRDADLAKQ
jgi:hypothetical protein